MTKDGLLACTSVHRCRLSSQVVTSSSERCGRYLPERLIPGRVKMASTVRDDAGGSSVAFAIVFLTFVFRGFIQMPSWVWWVVLAAAVLLAVKDGIRGLDVITLGIAGFIIVGPLVSGVITGTTTAPDLEEPIPVPSGYGFKLNPDSTNLEHKYDSGRLPPQRAEVAAVEVVDYYVNHLSSEWTLVSRQEATLGVELRQGDTSRGISISVSVVTPQGRPAVLVLSIRTLLCGEDLPAPEPSPGGCMAAPVSKLVRYPGGGPVPVAEPNTGPLREPVPLPPGYKFVLVEGISSEQVHAYVSTTGMSTAEADRGQRAVMRYYRQALNDWTIVETDEAKLVVKDPDSTSGLEIYARPGSSVRGGRVELEIRKVYCPEDYSCTWIAAG